MRSPGGIVERTLIIIKPDGVQRALVGTILARLEARGLRLVALKLMRVSESLARQHYAVHAAKPFFPSLIRYITSGAVVAGVVEGKDAVAVVRCTVGKTNPLEAAPGTIRGDFALEIGRNLIHASDSPETAAQEIALWFRPEELVEYERDIDRWIRE